MITSPAAIRPPRESRRQCPYWKPSPASAREPHDALFVGDSIFDMTAAKAAHVRSVAVLYGFGPKGFSEEADYTIDRIEQLVDIVKKLNG